MKTKSRMFELGDVLTITTGRLIASRHIEAVYEILNFMTGDNLFTHQLPRVADECKPYLLRQHPQLKAPELHSALEELFKRLDAENDQERRVVMIAEWLSEQSTIYGQEFEVTPIPKDDHTVKNPIKELTDMVGPEKVIVVEVPRNE